MLHEAITSLWLSPLSNLLLLIIIFLHGLGCLTCSGIDALPYFTRLRVFDYEYFIFLGRVTSPYTKPPFLEDQFVFLSLASHLWPVQLGRSYQEHKVPAGIACEVIEARKPPTTAR
jgi:hypothetical protein